MMKLDVPNLDHNADKVKGKILEHGIRKKCFVY